MSLIPLTIPIPLALLAGVLSMSSAHAADVVQGDSTLVTWSCTSTPCPWGPADSGHAIAWPASSEPISSRLGYTTSVGVYLPSQAVNGATIEILSGTATAYAGQPEANSHYVLAPISAGGSFVVNGLAPGEVLSVQGGSAFAYKVTFPEPVSSPSGLASQLVTWSCTGSPCPWGPSDRGQALAWPAELGALSNRLGYTTSNPIYLPSNVANGLIVNITSGTAVVYVGAPGANSHSALTTISAGGSYEVAGLTANQVLSVQGSTVFTYEITVPEPSDPGEQDPASQLITWSCTSAPCPWGPTDTGHAVVWPSFTGAGSNRLGYATSAPIYLPAIWANEAVIWVTSGAANVYAGAPNSSSHHLIATIIAGDHYSVAGLQAGHVLSVQSMDAFTFRIELPEETTPPDETNVIESVAAYWRCNTPGCSDPDWIGEVINWPSWAAYPTNSRAGSQSRIVYSAAGELLYPYMGSWANGCQVSVVSGVVLIIEWERGTNLWRETWLYPGDTHTISLTSPEDGAMIETYDYGPSFSVTLDNCTPQALP